MAEFTREKQEDIKTTRYKVVPLANFDFRIRSLRASEMRAIRQSMVDRKGDVIQSRAQKLQDLLVARCLVDSAGKRLYSDEDAFKGEFDEWDGGVLSTLFAECKEFTGFASDGDWDLIEAAAKNSESTRSNSSANGSLQKEDSAV